MWLDEAKNRLLATSETAEKRLAQVNYWYIKKIQPKENVLKGVLFQLHNAGEIDFFEIARGVNKISNGHVFFTILHAFVRDPTGL